MIITRDNPTPAKLDRPRRLSPLPDLSPELLVPELAGVPKPIREAADNARRLWEVYEQERLAFTEAEQDVSEAPAVDATADAAALDAGTDLPERTEPAKRQALSEANRRKLAAEQNLRAAINAQAEAIREHYGEWRGSAAKRVDGRAAAIRKLIDELDDEFAALHADQAVLAAIDYFNGDPGNWHLQIPRRDAAQRQREKAAKALAAPPLHAPVPRELPALLAALAAEIEAAS